MDSCVQLAGAVVALAALASASPAAAADGPRCGRLGRAFDVGDPAAPAVIVWRTPEPAALVFRAGLSIDADGAPNAYHPDGAPGLDHLGNAGRPGNWWALVTDTGRRDGQPVVQGPADPFPGFYVSTTSLHDRRLVRTDPRRYVDATAIRYVVLPNLPAALREQGVHLGDLAAVRYRDRLVYAIFADLGPRRHLGEGSVALADALGIPSDARRGGVARGVTVVVFPGSGDRQPRAQAAIDRAAARRFGAWGGLARLDDCAGQL